MSSGGSFQTLPAPIIWIGGAFLGGVVLAANLSLPVTAWLGLALIPILFLAFPIFRRIMQARFPAPYWLIPVSLISIFLGAARYQVQIPEITPEFIGFHNDDGITYAIVGVVDDFPDVRDRYINLRVAVEQIRKDNSIEHSDSHGLLLARVSAGDDWAYGDRIVLSGKLITPPENEEFSYRDYLARRGIYSFMSYAEGARLETGQGNPIMRIIFDLRQKALDLVYRFFPDPEASLAAGILLGVESGISQDVENAFVETGTSHVIAISGFNVTIVIGLIIAVFGRVMGRNWGALLAGVTVIGYTILVGGDAAVVRAAFMAGFTLLARQVGRRQDGISGLVLTAAVMALHDPNVLSDVGFQLSFAATLGLVLYAEPLSEWFAGMAEKRMDEALAARVTGRVSDYFLFTVAAQLTTLPIIAFHFQRISISSLPTNIAILPAQPMIMLVGGAAVLVGLLLAPLGQLLAYIAWPFLAYTIRVVEWFAQFDGGTLYLGEITGWGMILIYGLMFGLTAYWEPFKSWLSGEARTVILGATLGLVTFWIWQGALQAPDGLLHITVLDVGTGEGVLVQTPQGRNLLINGGPSLTRLSEGLGRRLPLFLRELDFIVVAAPREEYTTALPRTISRYTPAQILWAGPPNASFSARNLRQAAADRNIEILDAKEGDLLDLGLGATIEFLKVGRRGAVLIISWKNFRMLIPSGIDFAELEELGYGVGIGPVTALLLAESGYAPANPPEWIANLRPQVILLSVAAGDYDGLPDAETLEAVEAYTLLRTDLNGWIELTTDGEQMWVEVARE